MRNVLHKTAAAGYSAEKLASGGKLSSSGNGNAWGDTPDTAEMECIAQLERDAALRQRLENSIALPAAPLHDDGQQAPPSASPRHLTYSPAVLEPCVARSGSGRALRRQLSHLGRTSLATSSPAAAAGGGGSSRAEARSLPSMLPPHMHKVSIGAVRPPEEDSVALNEESRVDIKRQKVNSGAIENQVKFNPLPKQQQGTTGAAYDFVDSDDEIEAEAAAEITNEIATQAHPNNHTPPPLELRSYLSPDISEAILRIGGPEILYQWQGECLYRPGVLQGRNLVYCAPTSGGKSLVADIIFLRRFVETGRPGLLVLPFISLCNEKKSYWDTILQPLDREAREYYGPTSTSAPISPRTGIIVATLEKANHLITQLLEENALGMLSSVIIDELHMVGDEHRGYQLELMLTKLRFAGAAAFEEEELVENSGGGGENIINNNLTLLNKQREWLPVMGLEEGTQIIGMSATLPNVSIVAKWLGAELYITDFRPVPLRQFLKSGNLIKDESGAVVRTIPECTTRFNIPAKEVQAKDPDHVAFLTQETVGEGFSVLVFCATRSASEATATVLSQLLTVPERHILVKKDALDTVASRCGLRHVHRASIAEQIGKLSSSHGRKLSSLVEHGVGYHHAGMEPEDREFIELAFKCGAISVLCATSSLAAGVNLPARRVIFRHPYVGLPTNYLDSANYRQMRGRAGRAGIDTHGESFLVVLQKSTEKRLAALMHAEPAPVESCLTLEKCGMKRAMLEVVASGAVLSPSDVDRYIKCTLLAATSESEVVVHATKEALKWLGDKERQFIYWDKKTGKEIFLFFIYT
jgi:DNA polymerase theta